MSGLPVPPTGTDLSEDRSWQLLIVYAVSYSFALFAIILRVIARRGSGAGFWWDDWLMIPVIIFSTAYLGLGLETPSSAGFGRHVWAIGYAHLVYEMKKLFAGEFLYLTILLCLNFSILALYWRIYSVSKLRFIIWAMAGLFSAWYIACTTMVLVECTPLYKFWDILALGYCSDLAAVFFGGALTHAILDSILLLIPIPLIWQLQMDCTQKILVTGAFTVGSFAVVLSGLRLVYIFRFDSSSIDLTWESTNTILLTALEVNVSTIATCLPALLPIYRYLATGRFERITHRDAPIRSPSPSLLREAASPSQAVSQFEPPTHCVGLFTQLERESLESTYTTKTSHAHEKRKERASDWHHRSPSSTV